MTPEKHGDEHYHCLLLRHLAMPWRLDSEWLQRPDAEPFERHGHAALAHEGTLLADSAD